MIEKNLLERYSLFGIICLVLLFIFWIFSPFAAVLVIAAAFAVVLHPLHAWFLSRVKGRSGVAAAIVVALLVVVVGVPLIGGLGTLIFQQATNLKDSLQASGGNTQFIQDLVDSANNYLPKQLEIDFDAKVKELVTIFSSNITSILTATFTTVAATFLFIIALFYFLKDGAQWKKIIVAISPLADEDDTIILDQLSHSVGLVMKGYLFIAIIQGLLMGLGLYIFGVPNAALWGVVAGVAAVIPMVGTGLVGVPAILYLFVTGNILPAIGLLVWSFVLVGTIDNFLQPIIVGGTMKISPLLILFSVLGGVSVLGPVGILIGPLSISLLYSLIGVYKHKAA